MHAETWNETYQGLRDEQRQRRDRITQHDQTVEAARRNEAREEHGVSSLGERSCKLHIDGAIGTFHC